MKALTLRQPYAAAVVLGFKHIETRSWATSYRGPLWIHAARGKPWPCSVSIPGDETAWRGMVLGRCQLVDVCPVEALRFSLSSRELALGDYASGRYGWVLEDAELIDPWPARGQLGLFVPIRDETVR